MIGPEVVRSLALAFALAVTVTAFHRRLPPRVATHHIATVLVMFAAAAISTVVLLGLAFLAHAPLVGVHLRWCSHGFADHGEIPLWLGGAAALWLPLAAARVGRVIHRHRRVRCRRAGPMVVTDDLEPYAVTMPGPGRRIVVSRGLLEQLDPREASVVVAHERAHARHRHDRYLLLGEVVVAVVPPLRWLADRLGFSVERWADETAAAECRDRRLVAHTLGKVALFRVSAPSGTGFARLGVLERIRMLLAPPPEVPPANRRWALRAAAALTGGAAAHQMIAVAPLVMMICH